MICGLYRNPNMKDIKVKYVNYGIANRFSDHIEINKNIKKYPNLHRFILNHEQEHTDSFSVGDFASEFTIPPQVEMLQFISKNPSAFLYEIMPIKRIGKRIIYEPYLLLFYGIIMLIAGVIYYVV